MAIRMRRGNEADFDPEKMLPGEWAVSTDTKYVRMCFTPGIVLRMATYEAFESDMAEIRKILLECQSIQTAVELIQNNVTDSELVVENYVKEAKQYRDEAEQFRNETEQFKNEAFSTTSGLIINNTASGDTIHLTDSAKSKVLAFGLYGKAVQNKYTGKNRIPYPYRDTTKELNGIIWTDLGDGRIKADGTATADSYFELTPFTVPKGTYTVTGSIKVENCPVQLSSGNDWYMTSVNGGTRTKTYTEDVYYNYNRCLIKSGVTVNNHIFEPMLRLADIVDDTFEPYVGGIPAPNPDYPQEITISKGKYDSVAVTLESGDRTEVSSFALRTDGLAGIPVDSDGNYTDENGQQWICDEIVKYADGSGKRIQRIGMKIIESSTVIALTNQAEDGVCTFSTVSYWLSDRLNSVNAKGMCDKLIFGGNHYNGSQIIASGDGKMCFINSTAYNTVYFNTSKATTVQEFHSLFDGMKIYYILAEPIETDLTFDELKVYENLQTFYPVTNISNNANCGMSITYVADTKNYIDNKIASLEKALYNNI